ncbi:ABA4-like family protein [Streptosporangium sp. NPDC051022]|uniref:ABA4-like family protein n=1 Tax=Streptosporangium sp. NPDC051022 TaxID=3155752 RepID=UPI003446C2CA
MTVDTLFDVTFPLVVPFWALMIIAPTWSVTHRISSSPLIVLPPLAVYLVLVVPRFSALWAVVSTTDLDLITAFFGQRAGAAILWAHVIAFDLFVGRWMYLDSRERRVHPLLMGPVLLLTILLSPIGLMVYLVIRYAVGRPAPDAAGERRPPVTSKAG